MHEFGSSMCYQLGVFVSADFPLWHEQHSSRNSRKSFVFECFAVKIVTFTIAAICHLLMRSNPDSVFSFLSVFLSDVHTLSHLPVFFTMPTPTPILWFRVREGVCVCKGLAVMSTVLARPSQRQRSLAEFSHTGAEWDGLLTHTMGSTPSHSRNTHTHNQVMAPAWRVMPPLSYPLQTGLVCVCLRTTHPDSSSDGLFSLTLHCHTHSHMSHTSLFMHHDPTYTHFVDLR